MGEQVKELMDWARRRKILAAVFVVRHPRFLPKRARRHKLSSGADLRRQREEGGEAAGEGFVAFDLEGAGGG